MKLFFKKNGGVVQLIELEQINDWSVEMSFIFADYIRTNKLKTYRDAEVEADVSKYLDEIVTKVGLPNLKKIFEGDDRDEITSTLDLFEDFSETKASALQLIKPLLGTLIKNSIKTIGNKAQKILNNL